MRQLANITLVKENFESNNIPLWVSKDFESCQSESIASPLAKGESIAQIVNDVMEGLYPNVIALWYDLESKKVTLAFAKREAL